MKGTSFSRLISVNKVKNIQKEIISCNDVFSDNTKEILEKRENTEENWITKNMVEVLFLVIK